MLSGSYASRLKEYPNKGICGLPERYDSERILSKKIDQLAKMMTSSKYTVILTGAGISTAAGIPDFRGPNGIWTLEGQQRQTKKKRPSLLSYSKTTTKRGIDETATINTTTIAAATTTTSNKISRFVKLEEDESSSEEQGTKLKPLPTFTHHAIASLVQNNLVQLVVTQNVDGLHETTGIPRHQLSVLHGCIYTECCEVCKKEYFRDFEIETIGLKKTGRYCDDNCQGALRDTTLDWEDDLPEIDWGKACDAAEKADLVLTLGTSLRIEPAGSLGLDAKEFAIVNLQETAKDSKASLIIKAKVDDVMRRLINHDHLKHLNLSRSFNNKKVDNCR